nr:MAG TPA: hypothetical protein [Caudoviricetes sp.]
MTCQKCRCTRIVRAWRPGCTRIHLTPGAQRG